MGVFNKENKIILKNEEEIAAIKESCMIVSGALAEVATMLKAGITGLDIDKRAEEYIRDQDAIPGFLGYGDFPGTLCISPNEHVVHGIPSKKEFKEGDIVSVDCGSILNDFFGDSAFTFAIGEVSKEAEQLMEETNNSLYLGIEQARKGNRIGDIGFAVQNHVHQFGYTVIRELVGHGVGRDLHEAPEVPNYGRKGQGPKIEVGLVIAIEPMVNAGKRDIVQSEDGWSIVTRDGKLSAHFEHSIAVLDDGPICLSDHSKVMEAVKNNSNLSNISIKK